MFWKNNYFLLIYNILCRQSAGNATLQDDFSPGYQSVIYDLSYGDTVSWVHLEVCTLQTAMLPLSHIHSFEIIECTLQVNYRDDNWARAYINKQARYFSVVDVMTELLRNQIGLYGWIPRWAIFLPIVSLTWVPLGTTGIDCVVKE